ncbi:MAG: fibronectin type III domain-containing protein [Bacillota bacterium]|nr:fibronectin type III domain-containing protein [Bacillota bacterium]
MNSKKVQLIKRISVMLQVFIVITTLTFPIKTFALNSYTPQGKAPNLMGYRVIDDHTLQIFTDKSNPIVEAAEFHIFHGTNSEGESIAINDLTVDSGLNFSGLKGQLPSGSNFILTTAKGAFKSGEIYTVVINNNITYGSGSLGWFSSHTDQMISFTIPNTFANPNSNSEYSVSSEEIIKSWPMNNAANVPVEGNIWITSSIPIKNYTQLQQNLIIKKNGIQLRYDNYLYTGTDTIPNKNADIFAPVINDDHNSIVIPLTVGSHTAPCYNLEQGAQYEVVIPEMELVNGQVISEHSIVFHTAGSTVSNKFSSGNPVAIIKGNNVKIDWSNIAPSSNAAVNISGDSGPAYISPAPTGYNIYASTDKYWNYVKLNSCPITGTSFDTTNCGLKANTTYYFRISTLSNANVITGAKGDTVESGFSNEVEVKTPIETKVPYWLEGSKINILNLTKDSVTLIWTSASDDVAVTSYRIFQNGALIKTVDGNNTSFNINNLAADTEYSFKVEAGDDSDNWSDDGPSITCRTLDSYVPVAPNGISNTLNFNTVVQPDSKSEIIAANGKALQAINSGNLNLVQDKTKAESAINNASIINDEDEKRNSVAGVPDSNKDAKVGVKEIKAVKKVESTSSKVNWKVLLILLIILVFILRISTLMTNFRKKENSSLKEDRE